MIQNGKALAAENSALDFNAESIIELKENFDKSNNLLELISQAYYAGLGASRQ